MVLAGLLLFELYASGLLNVWLYVLQIGNTGQIWYSNRFSTPIFYLLEMVWPYSDKHPISLLLYGLGLAGLALLAYRRKPQDNFLLVWFIAIYIIFTIIPNRQWRYVTPLFPVLAISASVIVASIIGRAQRAWQSTKSSLTKVRLAKFAGALLIIFVAAGVFYSSMDAITWAGQNQPQVPVQEAATYAMSKTQSNQSILVLCPHNLFSKDMVSFYLNCKSANKTPVYQYPELGVDAYTPEFNVTELVKFCQTNDTKMLCYTNTAEQYHTTTAPGLSKRSL